MASSAHERLLQVVTGNPGTGAVTVGAAIVGYQGFVAGDNGNAFDVVIYSVDANGNANGLWEVQAQAVYTSGTTSLARVAGNVVDGSSGPGTLVNFASGIQRVANVNCTAGVEIRPTIQFNGGAINFQRSDGQVQASITNNGRVSSISVFCAPAISPDISLWRAAAGVWAVGSGAGSGAGWCQITAGEAALNAAFTNATAVMANTNISFNVIAGRSYRIEGILQVSNSTAADGVQIDFNGGTATATTFFAAATTTGTVSAGTLSSTSLAGVINCTSITGTDYLTINGYIKVNAGGTLVLRAAENSHTTGTLTVGAGSWIALADTVNL